MVSEVDFKLLLNVTHACILSPNVDFLFQYDVCYSILFNALVRDVNYLEVFKRVLPLMNVSFLSFVGLSGKSFPHA